MSRETPRGIDDLRERQPIGCALAMGRKGPSGAPVDKHRFFVVRPVADGMGREARRAEHPAFGQFNQLADPTWNDAARKAHDEKRASVRGILVHARPEDAYTLRRQADRLRGHEHPRLGPSCMGNGEVAERFFPDRGDYGPIPCPGARCEFAAAAPGQRASCHPHVKLVFQLRFDNLPCLLCKYSSNGWGSTSGIHGFFGDLRQQAAALGVEEPSVYGIPFVLTLSRRSNPAAKTAWVEVSMSADFPPGMTLQEYLLRQADARRQLAGAMPLLALGMAASAADADIDEIADDARALRPGSVPAVFDHPEMP